MILGIDTSTGQAGIALASPEGLIAEIGWAAGRNHSTGLFRALATLFELTGLSLADVSELAVAAGPGSFSGIRVGLSMGKAIHFGQGAPLVAVSTLDLVAAGAGGAQRVMAVLRAGRGQLYSARYEAQGSSFRQVSPPVIATPEELGRVLESGERLAGEGAAEVRGALPDGHPAASQRPVAEFRRAGYLAELGRAYFAEGGRDQSHEAEPLYLRRSAAEEKRDEARGLSGETPR